MRPDRSRGDTIVVEDVSGRVAGVQRRHDPLERALEAQELASDLSGRRTFQGADAHAHGFETKLAAKPSNVCAGRYVEAGHHATVPAPRVVECVNLPSSGAIPDVAQDGNEIAPQLWTIRVPTGV